MTKKILFLDMLNEYTLRNIMKISLFELCKQLYSEKFGIYECRLGSK